MAEPTTTPAPLRDPLNETLQALQLEGSLYCQAELSAPWGLEIPPMHDSLMLLVVMSGSCQLRVGVSDPSALRSGSLVLLPRGTSFRVGSAADVATESLLDMPVQPVTERFETLRHGGGGAVSRVMCGVLQVDHAAAEQLLSLLPEVLVIDGWEDEGDWLQSTVRFIAQEAAQLRPGSEVVLTRLADILVVQAIRTWIESDDGQRSPWIRALRDAQLGRALAAVHDAPGRDWSVARLAKLAGMSRSGFSARFTDVVGVPAMHYVTRWRMQVARTWLRASSKPIGTVADALGYRSEASFSRAFKRTFGHPPSHVRTDRGALGDGPLMAPSTAT
ncbi:MAG: AraC family transcriptional regulator [Myxococcales bacterium]|nr:AraC family transcriptional regulator [Myxococcales bacterium]